MNSQERSKRQLSDIETTAMAARSSELVAALDDVRRIDPVEFDAANAEQAVAQSVAAQVVAESVEAKPELVANSSNLSDYRQARIESSPTVEPERPAVVNGVSDYNSTAAISPTSVAFPAVQLALARKQLNGIYDEENAA